MRLRRQLQLPAALLTAAAVVLISVPGATPASASRGDHLAVLAGSSHHLVYVDDPVVNGTIDYAHGELHVRSARGRDRDLGTGFGTTDPAAADHYAFSIVGSTLTGYSTADPSHVEWWNLSADTSGTGTLPAGSTWQGSAPDGWVLVEPDHTTVAVQAISGGITSYGQPVAAETGLAGSVTAVSGPSGIVGIGEKSGGMSYQRWRDPSQVTTLDPGAAGVGLSCADASKVIVACLEPATADQRATHVAIPLDGSAASSYPGCSSQTVAIGSALEWVCGQRRSHARFTTATSTVRTSAVAVAPVPGVSALGALVTVGPNQDEVLSIRNSHSKSHVLVSIPSPIIQLDNANLRGAAHDVEAEAIASGALHGPATYRFPAQVLQAASDALIRSAQARHPGLRPSNTRSVMGPVPAAIKHHVHRRPHHRHIRSTHALARFRHAVPDRGSGGLGTHATHGGATPAPFRPADGVYVDPQLDQPAHPTIGMVALRTALSQLGQPYVWAAGGPSTFDCSGLTQWAYAHAGIHLTHYTVSQWNEGRLIRPTQILPGDLILFEHVATKYLHHVGIYLGAGWMLNAPYTGQYVSVTKVPFGVAGVVRP